MLSKLHTGRPAARAGAGTHSRRHRVAVCRAQNGPAYLSDLGLVQQGFGTSPSPSVQIAVLGDLHLAPEQMGLFNAARDQIRSNLCDQTGAALQGSKVVQLGDLGHGKHKSGSRSCFEYAREYLKSFGLPYTLVLGNHDMEGDEFPTDPDNLEAWQDVWKQNHHWCVDLGPCVAIGLSTTRYRSNAFSHHEVHVDEAQMAWFEAQLKTLSAQRRPVIVFTHAPPQGCGLQVIQEVHVKNRCAWLNHSDRPERFMQLVERYPDTIKLWFSGHFHLSHNYRDSISVVGSTAFVQTGVIGQCHRDGHRHSRLLTADATSYRVWTLDHNDPTASPRLDLSHRFDDPSAPAIVTPSDAFLNSAEVAGWLSSQLECTVGATAGQTRVRRKQAQSTRWYSVGNRTILALQDGLLVEYDLATRAPVGLVCKVPTGCEVVLRTADGGAPDARGDGSDVQVVEVVDHMAGGSSRYPRNEQGGFFVIYQPNKWKLKQAKLMEERQAAQQAAAGAPAAATEAVKESVSVAA